MITVVLLAAGRSSRTSVMKQLYRVRGEYLINLQCRELRTYGFDVVVVLGYAYKKISMVLDRNVRIIYNEKYEAGMFSSVKKVFNTLDAAQFIFCHVDRPVPERDVFEALLANNMEIAVTCYQGEKAPPIRIRTSMKKRLLHSSAKRLDHWIAEEREHVAYVEVNDPKVHCNANTDEALHRCFNEGRM